MNTTKSLRKIILSMVVGLTAFSAYGISMADTISIDQKIWQEDLNLDPMSLSAQIDFFDLTPGDNIFRMALRNTSGLDNPDDFPSAVLLTGIGFNLSANSIIGGTVLDTNRVLIPTPAPGDPLPDSSEYWGYDNSPISSGYFKYGEVTTKSVNTVVSTMTAATTDPFQAFSGNGNPIAGPDWGVLSSAYTPPGTKAYTHFIDTIYLDITLSGIISNWNAFIDDINAADVVVAFGSPTAPTPIPEPTSMLLFCSGIAGLVFKRRKNSF